MQDDATIDSPRNKLALQVQYGNNVQEFQAENRRSGGKVPLYYHGFHLSGLTKFPDVSSIFSQFFQGSFNALLLFFLN